MSKHTAGPWVFSSESSKIIMSGSFIDGHDGYIIGSVSGNDNSGYFAGKDEAKANAMLIVSAPDLLEQLEETHAALCFTDGYLGSIRCEKNAAVISKARGEA